MMCDPGCLGCRTSFEQGEIVSSEGMIIEHKQFSLPLKDNKAKWTLLKTIVGFLNCKGGTIYIGVEDREAKVVGLSLTRKEQDDFRLFVKQLLERVYPIVDLQSREEVLVQFVPVMRNRVFEGKYVVKCIVQQGISNQTYHFSQKIKLEGGNDSQEFEIIYGYFRHGMGGISEMKGLKLIEEVQRKAAIPNERFNTFHKGCNPPPSQLSVSILSLCFSKVGKNKMNIMKEIFSGELAKLELEHKINEEFSLQSLFVIFENEKSFEIAKQFVSHNLQVLNSAFQEVKFIEVGKVANSFVYENSLNVSKSYSHREPSNQHQKESSKNARDRAGSGAEREVPSKKEKEAKFAPSTYLNPSSPVKNKPFCLTFTHINPYEMDNFVEFLNQKFGMKKQNIAYIKYENTLQAYLENQQNMDVMWKRILKNPKILEPFGFNGHVIFGVCLLQLKIFFYDVAKRKEMAAYLTAIMRDSLKDSGFRKQGNKYAYYLYFNSSHETCVWLDKLLHDKILKGFRIPGAASGQSAKMKIYLECSQN